jgi:Brp/Blh family beta-carotene 15,15'-monooxygenase
MATVHERGGIGSGTFAELVFGQVPLAAAVAAVAASIALGPAWSARAGPWPWVVALVAVGLPHGAADLAVSRRFLGRAGTIAGFAVYAVVVAAVAAVFAAAPVVTIVIFLALSVWHFGAAHADGQSPATARPGSLALGALARGGPVLGVPLAVHPEASAAVARDLAALVGRHLDASVATVRGIGIFLLAIGIAALAVEAWRTRRDPGGPRRVATTAADLTPFVLLGAVADPLFSVGVYFLGWHAWRQMRPLAAALDLGPIRDCRSLGRALVRIHVAALPLLVPTWAVVAAVWWLVPDARSPRGLALVSLAVYVAVTPSHDLLIDWLRSHARRPEAADHGPDAPCTGRSSSCSS